MSKKILRDSVHFRLIQTNNTNGRPSYIIRAYKGLNLDMEEVRNIVDPNRNISGKNGKHWRFRKYEDADKLWVYLTLRYS